jgi:uncharacterized membrane protein
MTSDDIKSYDARMDSAFWLQEIAYQLAVMNERNAAPDTEEYILKLSALASVLSDPTAQQRIDETKARFTTVRETKIQTKE